jgi:hypothetical protein
VSFLSFPSSAAPLLALALAFGFGGQWAADKLGEMEKRKFGSVHPMKKAA